MVHLAPPPQFVAVPTDGALDLVYFSIMKYTVEEMNNTDLHRWENHMQNISIFVIFYLLVVNIAGFAIMGIDKKRAIRKAYRIPEATLFLTALIGGSAGSLLGMYTFRHKTKHWYFAVGMPIILAIQLFLACIPWLPI